MNLFSKTSNHHSDLTGLSILRRAGLYFRARFNDPWQRPLSHDARLLALEGVLFSLLMNLINNNNNLFATRLGATDFQISLVSTIPPMVGLVMLIPGALLADRLSNKKKMVLWMIALMAAAYMLTGFTPWLGSWRVWGFLIMLAVAFCPQSLYNTTWQAFFADAVLPDDRNRVFTLRTRLSYLAAIVVPLISGQILAAAAGREEKLRIHQAYCWIGVIILIIQFLVMRRVQGGEVQAKPKILMKDLAKVLQTLWHSRTFMVFLGIILLFHATWQFDWTLFYLAQVNYLGADEAWLSFFAISNALAQLISINFWSHLNERRNVTFTMIFGNLSLVFFPMAMVLVLGMPAGWQLPVFLVFNFLCSIPFTVIPLNLLQCLLQVIPSANRTLSISIYQTLVLVFNAFMPTLGVQIYLLIGGNRAAMQQVLTGVMGIRVVFILLWLFYWRWFSKKRPAQV